MQRGKKIINGSLVTLVKFKGHEHAGDDENLWLFTEEWEMKMGKIMLLMDGCVVSKMKRANYLNISTFVF